MPYLINGLNAALLKFNRIGHFDHPGTPFQLFNGIAIRLTHLLSGKAPIAEDVFARPEHYLMGIKAVIAILQAWITLAIGMAAKRKNIDHSLILILQGGVLFSDMLLWTFGRAIPERWFVITSLLFILVYVKYAYNEKDLLRFATWCGVIMAMGLATKFNYLPVLIIPLLMLKTWKHRMIYSGAGLVSFLLFISPIIDNFKNYRRFITSIATHDGIYGSGEARMLNPDTFMEGLAGIFTTSTGIHLWIILIICGLLLAVIYRNKDHARQYVPVFSAFLLATVLQIVMVAKHFKNAYMAPLQTVLPLLLFVFVVFLTGLLNLKRGKMIPALLFFALFAGMNLHRAIREYQVIDTLTRQQSEVHSFVENHMPPAPAWFVDPTWLNGPHRENAIVYGLSYCRDRDKYLPELKKLNPNLITYEGHPEEVKIWRGEPVLTDSILVSGRPLYLYDTPGRQAGMLKGVLEQAAIRTGKSLSVDTIFHQEETQTRILKISTDE